MIVDLLTVTPDAEKHIELCGRTCYKSFDKITEESSSQFIKMLIKAGHESVIEHASASFRISGVSRALTHQLVRHRVASFSQESQRYVGFNSEFPYVTPPSIQSMEGGINDDLYKQYHNLMFNIHQLYEEFIKRKACKAEDARFVLPNACETEIVITANFREWRHILQERMASGAQWEIKQLMQKIIIILKEHAPNVFYDFEV